LISVPPTASKREARCVTKSVNALLNSAICSRLASQCDIVALETGEILYTPGEPFRFAHFPQSGLISLVQHFEDGEITEVGIVGADGFLGVPLLLGDAFSTTEAVVQVPGEAIRIPATELLRYTMSDVTFRSLLLKYAQYLHMHVSQTAACNRRHSLHQRLSRWLLEIHDRMATDELPLRHEFLAQMLGSRRAGVTMALGDLRLADAIKLRRASISVVSRNKLEAEACECYQTVREAHKKLMCR
jgi:CRP-like cAMP-binding protein